MLSKESYINRVIKEVLPTINHGSEQTGELYESHISKHTALFTKKNKPAVSCQPELVGKRMFGGLRQLRVGAAT